MHLRQTESAPTLELELEPATPMTRVCRTAALTGVIIANGMLAYFVMRSPGTPYTEYVRGMSLVVVFPVLLAMALGAVVRSRRFAAGVGASLALAVVAAVFMSLVDSSKGEAIVWVDWELETSAIVCGIGALLGVLGAEVRRQVSKRR
jgi:hypothetical protein